MTNICVRCGKQLLVTDYQFYQKDDGPMCSECWYHSSEQTITGDNDE